MMVLHCILVMLSWFVAPDEVETALKNREKLKPYQVQCHPDSVPSACIDDAVDMSLVKKFFTAEAWRVVEVVMKAKADSNIYSCGICSHTLGSESISCDTCLKWFDFKCVGIKTSPKALHWFCRDCRSLYATK